MPFKNKLKDVDYFFNQMGQGIIHSLTEEQEQQIRLVLAKAIRIPSKKIIDLNVPFWFFKKYYMQLYLGEDKRKGNRKPQKNKASENIIERDYRYFFYTLPKEVIDSLNFEQKRSIQDILKRCIVVPTKKIYESNNTFRFFKKDMYLSFFLGYDKRKGQRAGASTKMFGLNMGVRGFIYLIELAIAVGIVYGVINLIGSFIHYNPAASVGDGSLDDLIEEKIGEQLQGGYSLPNPLEIIDFYWWNYLHPLF
ncbi:MAG: hypothetical protein K9N06_05615 [Candidatus Cloacimonetes bacterium]|nr:hypothetical protein [Candidatus Cloacimonadota bacterium]